MNILSWLRSRAALRAGASLSLATALLFVAVPRVSAALLTLTQGSATTTITSLVFNPDTTISIEAVQSGYLSNVGTFTAEFAYTAVPSPATIVLVGSGTLYTANGDRMYLTASILEVGLDYPRTLTGTLTITGGTGRYKGATGAIVVSGIDEESLTDTVEMSGTIITPGSLLGLLK